MILRFEVPGPPVPKGRPRFGKGHAYTPKRTRAYELSVAWHATAARGSINRWPIDARYRVVIEAATPHDLDNVAKAILDACNGLLWNDDRQVDDLRVVRVVADVGAPGARVTVEVLPSEGT